jgi:riboflavin kinase/FMN adenylyltransferase
MTIDADSTPRDGHARAVVTIGAFDGVHVGHQALVRTARAIARAHAGARVVVLAFDPSPAAVLAPARAPARLTTFERRRELLLGAGADEVVRLEPTPELLALEPEAFIRRCVDQYHPVAFVEGPDFHFGRARAGDVATLERLGRSLNFVVRVVESVEVTLTTAQPAPARSTVVRELLGAGRVRDAAVVLGRPHAVDGHVVRGDRRGRTIGYPTANVASDCMAPADGVYAALATLPDGRTLGAAVSVGRKPTFGEHERAVEAFLLRNDVGGSETAWSPIDGLPEYGWPIRLELLGWVREQVRFAALPALLEQMGRDVGRVREMVERAADPEPAREIPSGVDHRAQVKEAMA